MEGYTDKTDNTKVVGVTSAFQLRYRVSVHHPIRADIFARHSCLCFFHSASHFISLPSFCLAHDQEHLATASDHSAMPSAGLNLFQLSVLHSKGHCHRAWSFPYTHETVCCACRSKEDCGGGGWTGDHGRYSCHGISLATIVLYRGTWLLTSTDSTAWSRLVIENAWPTEMGRGNCPGFLLPPCRRYLRWGWLPKSCALLGEVCRTLERRPIWASVKVNVAVARFMEPWYLRYIIFMHVCST